MFSQSNCNEQNIQLFSKKIEIANVNKENNSDIDNMGMKLEMLSFDSNNAYRSISNYNYSTNDYFNQNSFNDKSNLFFIQKNDQITLEQKQAQQISKIDNNNKKTDAPTWNAHVSICSQGYESVFDSKELLLNIKQIFDEMVKTGYIDWNEISPFCIEGRIYTVHDDAQFRCEVFKFENTNSNIRSIVVIRKMCGDRWIFDIFHHSLLKKMSNKKCILDKYFINNENDNENDNENASIMNNFTNEIECDSGDNNSNDDEIEFTLEKASQLLMDAIDCQQDRDVLRENMLTFRLAIDNANKIKIIYDIENIFEHLLKPIIGEQQLYDTWMIKTILEIIIKLIEYGSTLGQSQKQQQMVQLVLINAVLCNIKQQWANMFLHPLGIFYFYPSQQIVRMCNRISLQ